MNDRQYRKLMNEIKKLQDEVRQLRRQNEFPLLSEPPPSEAEEQMIGDFIDSLDENLEEGVEKWDWTNEISRKQE